MRIAFLTLGCKVNSCETDKMKRQFEDAGHTVVAFSEPADVYVVNTCTVTNIADRKSRKMLHRARRMNPDALVAATGCYVDSAKRRGEADPAVDLFLPNKEKGQIVQKILALYQERAGKGAEAEAGSGTRQEAGEEAGTEAKAGTGRIRMSEAAQAQEHTRAYLKVQEGCNQFCAYCIIPYVRGPLRSKEQSLVLEEVRELAARGIQEVVVTGIHLSSYGADGGDARAFLEKQGEPLLKLLEAMHSVKGIRRIRLGSLEPRIITEDFAARLARIPEVCPHFHLSLQSGCDTVLQRMNRHYTTREYAAGAAVLRRAFDNPAITTDIIVGFPQETEEEFETTREYVETVGFAQIHVFKYSRRQGTAADNMEGQVPERLKTERSERLIRAGAESERRYQELFIGTVERILAEEVVEIQGKPYILGYTSRYVRIAAEVNDARRAQEYCNTMVNVHVLGYVKDGLLSGRIC